MKMSNQTANSTTEKRQTVLRRAIELFAEVGFRQADVQVIADRAQVGKGTVYRYFGNKQQLFWACVLDVMHRLEDHLAASIEDVDGSLRQLRCIGRAYAGFFDAHPERLEIFVQDRAEFRGSAPEEIVEYHRQLIDRFSGIIERGVAAGEIRPLDVKATIIAMGGLLYGSVVQACHVGIDAALTELVDHAIEIFLHGIRAPGAAMPDEET